MSDTTKPTSVTPPAPPKPEPTPAPTGMAAVIHAHLPAPDEAVSAAELALTAKIGHSTAGKALSTLEKLNLATRIRGTFENGHRTPDLWHRTPTTEECAESSADATPAESTAPASRDLPNPAASTHNTDESAEAPLPAQPDEPEPHGDGTDPTTAAVCNEATPSKTAPADESTAKTQQPAAQGEAAPPATGQRGSNGRLASGGLRQMVIDHLRAHPDEAFTATKISRVIERSSGAIANALVTLTNKGLAEKVSDKPLTYRLATTGPAAP
jgi:predicted transcriptional regulator